MTKTTERYRIREADHRTFGGIISPSDFNTDYRRRDNAYGSPIAQRIFSDKKFDDQCRKNIDSRNQNK